MQAKIQKVISSLLVVMLLFVSSSTVISYAAEGIMSSQELESQGISTNHSNVEFDVCYEGGSHSNVSDIAKTDTKINLKLNVKNAGYLKNITVSFANSNFRLVNDGVAREGVQAINTTDNCVTLNQINSGKNLVVSLTIVPVDGNKVLVNSFNKDNTVSFTGKYTDGQGKEINVTSNKTIHQEWNGKPTEVISQSVTKYLPIVENGENQLMVQEKVTSGLDKNLLPVKQSKLEVNVPKINNIAPKKVMVTANTTSATNGESTGVNFTTSNYNYDDVSEKVTITVDNNANSDGLIAWNKNVSDEYLVTYIYAKEVYNAVKDAGTTIQLVSAAKLALYNNNESNVSATRTDNLQLKDQIGKVVETNSTATSKLSKGYMINNKVASEENKKETEYSVKYNVKVGYAGIINSIDVNQTPDQFMKGLTASSSTVGGDNYTYNKSVVISKNEFIKLFGDDGEITISQGDTVLAKINKDSKPNDNGNVVIDVTASNTNSLHFSTTKPIAEGDFNIVINKAVSKNVGYSIDQINNFDSIKASATVKATNGTTTISEQNIDSNIGLDNTVETASLSFSKNSLSTITKNENVEIKATLKTCSANDTLYKNPTIIIHLPKSFENVEIKNVQLLFNSELTISSNQLIKNDDGTKDIKVVLNGTQTKYCSETEVGPTVLVTTNIEINKLTASKTENIVMNYSNENRVENKAVNAPAAGVVNTNVSLVAPTGVVSTNAILDYAPGSETVMSISGEEKTAKLQVNSAEQNAEFEMNVTNNYSNTIDHVVVLGRTPFKGNKDLEKSTDLGTTMTPILSSSLAVLGPDASKVVAYYSSNENATQDLNNATNGWKSINDIKFQDIKSYMLVINDYTMNQGDTFAFAYRAKIPANLQYNESIFENYAVFFNNNQTSGTISDKTYSPKIGATTGKGPIIESNVTTNYDNSPALIGDYIKYSVKLKNTGTEDASNVSISMNKPEVDNPDLKCQTSFINVTDENTNKYEKVEGNNQTIKIDTIKIGEETNRDIYLKLDYIPNGLESINGKVTVSGYKLAASTTKTVSSKVKKTVFNFVTKTSRDEMGSTGPLLIGQLYTYNVEIGLTDIFKEDNTYNSVDNVKASIQVPEGLTYVSSKMKVKGTDAEPGAIKYDEKTRTINTAIGKIEGLGNAEIEFTSKVDSLPEGVYNKDFKFVTNVKGDGVDESSSPRTDYTAVGGVVANYTSSIPAGSKIASGDDLVYKITVTNPGKKSVLVNVSDKLPEGVTLVNVTCKIGDKTENSYDMTDGTMSYALSLECNETADLEIKVNADLTDKEKNISNKPVIKYDQTKEYKLEAISHVIEATTFGGYSDEGSAENGENGQNGNSADSRKIQGTVWIDKNNDGVRDESEEKLSNVTVMLYNPATGNLVTDSQGKQLSIVTGQDGTYEFTNLTTGKYMVIFVYDSGVYSPTQYKAKGVNDDKNSDATEHKIVLYGETKVAAVTDNIELGSKNIYNIDLGLVSNPKFDLALTKTVSKITLKNSKETSEHEYGSNFAKLDIVGKQANDSTIIVEYKIKVSNEGAVAGYAKKVADYLPDSMKFNSELNKDWYVSDGVAYNASLASTAIKPGESKEITLVLTKKMTSENLGLINNTAEISEASNDLGLTDMDSIPGNKASNEDDMSSANVLTSIKTGQVIIYTALIVAVMGIIGFGVYMIKKKVLK